MTPAKIGLVYYYIDWVKILKRTLRHVIILGASICRNGPECTTLNGIDLQIPQTQLKRYQSKDKIKKFYLTSLFETNT